MDWKAGLPVVPLEPHCLLSVLRAPWMLPGSTSPAPSSASCVLGISSEALLSSHSLKGSWVWREAPSSQGKKWTCLEISRQVREE